jgi:CPA2 family monovalent cation:H+ antiporter-2
VVTEDVVTVLALVLVPALAAGAGAGASGGGAGALAGVLGRALLSVGGFALLMYVVGRRVIPWLLERVAREGSRELFTLGVLTVALGIAVGARRCSTCRSPSAPSSPAW